MDRDGRGMDRHREMGPEAGGLGFDRRASGGVEISCRMENGKAFLEWKLHFTGAHSGKGAQVRVLVTDMQGSTVLECRQQPDEEEPLRSVLLQPRLWKGREDPWLYEAEAVLSDGYGRCLDRVRIQVPLRSLGIGSRAGGLLLNGEELEPRAVRYLPPEGKGMAAIQGRMREDLQMLAKLGANCICLDGSREGREELEQVFGQLCDCMGFLAFRRAQDSPGFAWMGGACGISSAKGAMPGEAIVLLREKEMPILRGSAGVCPGTRRACCGGLSGVRDEDVLLPDGRHPGALYYKYLARWGKEPFVYIVPESVRRLESGNYEALCYSNCGRVALYSDGILFEFRRGEEAFAFHEIPAKSPCIMLTAEGDGCSESLSVHKSSVMRGQME